MGETIINLYRCEKCNRQLFEEDINIGKTCKCGSRRINHAAPTLGRIIWFLISKPKYLKVWFFENVRKCN